MDTGGDSRPCNPLADDVVDDDSRILFFCPPPCPPTPMEEGGECRRMEDAIERRREGMSSCEKVAVEMGVRVKMQTAYARVNTPHALPSVW